MRRFAFVIIAASIFMFSCNNGKQKKTTFEKVQTKTNDSLSQLLHDSIETEEFLEAKEELYIPQKADELFDDFFFNFVSNDKLQKTRTTFPITVTTTDTTYTIESSEWETDAFFSEQDYYTLIFDNEEHRDMGKNTTIDNVTVEKIMLETESVKSYIFSRVNGMWMLEAIKETLLDQNKNASFLYFYRNFANDIEFQNNSLCDAVKFITTDSSNDFNTMEGVITAESWPAFAPELPKDIIYNIIYSPINPLSRNKIFLLRGISNGLEVELYFILEQGRWKLAKLTT